MKKLLNIVLVMAMLVSMTAPAFALDGTWDTSVDTGVWGMPNNWDANTVASGAKFTATFNTAVHDVNRTISLESPYTIGNLIVETNTNNNWTLDNSGDLGNTLTLDNTGEVGAPVITVNDLGGGTATISAVVGGLAGFKKMGTGTLVLSGANTYAGDNTLTEGTLRVSADENLGHVSTSLVFAGGTLQAGGAFTSGVDRFVTLNSTGLVDTNGYAVSIAGGMSGAGGLTKLGLGTLTLTHSNTYLGMTTVNNGILSIASLDALPGWNTNGRYSVASGATLAVYNAVGDFDIATMLATTNFADGSAIGFDTTSGDRNYGGTLTNTGQGALGLTKTGIGTLTLEGANTYTGTTTVEGGGLIVTGASFFNGGTINTTRGIGNNAGNFSVTASGSINITTINTSAGQDPNYSIAGNNAGSVTLNSTGGSGDVGSITAIGSSTNTFSGGSGGAVTLTNTTFDSIEAYGGYGNTGSGGAGGAIHLINSDTNGGINANGGAGEFLGGGSGGEVHLTTGSSVGSITTNGGAGIVGGASGSGGDVTIENSASGDISAIGGEDSQGLAGGSGGSGGDVSLTDSTSGKIWTYGGTSSTSDGGSGGAVTLTDSTSGAITAYGGVGNDGMGGGTGGNGGNVTLSNSDTGATPGNIDAYGGAGGTDGGNGGDVSLTNSDSGVISAYGGNSPGAFTGNGGTVTLSAGSTSGDIFTYSGDSNFAGSAGDVTLTGDSTCGVISAYGGTGMETGGKGGTINLTNSTTDGNIIKTYGGEGAYTDGGDGGNVTLNNSTSGAIWTYGGRESNGGPLSKGGSAGDVTLSAGSTCGAILAYGGNDDGGGAGTAGNGGDITIMSGTNTVTGDINVSGGTSTTGSAGTAGKLILAGGSLNFASLTGGGDVNFTGGTLQYKSTGVTQDISAQIKNSTSAIKIDTNENNVDFASAITAANGNTAGLTKSGTGTLTLGGANTYTGGTTLTLGTLNINSTTALGATAGAFTINGGTIDNTSGSTNTIANNNPITLGGDFGFSTTAGTASNNLNLGNGAVTNSGSRTITLNGAGALTFGGIMTNTLAGVNTLTVTNGLGTTATSAVNFGGYALSNTADNRIDVIAGSGNVNITGAIINGGTSTASGLTYTGSGTLILSGDNTYDGLTTMNGAGGAGWLTLSGDNSGAGGGVTLTSGTLNINSATALGAGTFTIGNDTTFNNSTGAAITNTGVNAVNLGGNFTFTGTKDLNLGAGAVTNAGNRTIQINGTTSTLTMGTMTNTSNAVQTTTVNGAGNTLVLGGYALSNTADNRIDVIAGSGNVNITGAVTNGGTSTASGLTYTGTGTLTLSGAASNTYTGTTTLASTVSETQRLTLSKTGGAVAIAGNVTIDNINSPFLNMTETNQFGATSVISWVTTGSGNGRFQMQGKNQSVAGLSSTGTADTDAVVQNVQWGVGVVGTANCTLTIDTAAGPYSWNGFMRDQDNNEHAYTLSLTKSGAGTQILYGSNLSYTGKTIISAGTLQLGTGTSGGTLYTSEIDFTGGTFQYGGTNTQDISGKIKNSTGAISINTNGNDVTFASALAASNTLGLTKAGAGTLALNSANSYTGATTISGGTIVAGNASALSDGNVANNATLDVGLIDLDIGGTYIQGGTGTLRLTANSGTEYGSVTSVGGSVAGGIYVTVGGYMANNTTLDIVAGTAGYTVLDSAINSSNSNYVFTGSKSGDVVTLLVNRSTNGFASDAANANEANVGRVLDSITNPTADMTTVLNAMDLLTPSQTASALNSMEPDTNGAAIQVTQATLDQLTEAVLGHQSSLRGGSGVATGSDSLKGLDVWSQSFGSYLHQSPRQLSQGYNANIWGTALGFDLPVFNDIRVGTCFGFAQDYVRGKDNSNRNDINSYQWTIYGEYTKGPFYLDLSGAFAFNTYDASRQVNAGPTINRTASADYNGQQYQLYAEAGYVFNFKDFGFEKVTVSKIGTQKPSFSLTELNVTPLVSFQYQHLAIDKYTESGAGALNLNVKRQNYDLAQTGFGIKLDYPLNTKYGQLVPELRFKWLYDWVGDAQQNGSTFTGGGAAFATNGFTPAQSTWDFGTKLTMYTKKNWTLAANYDFELKEQFYGHYGYINAKYSF